MVFIAEGQKRKNLELLENQISEYTVNNIPFRVPPEKLRQLQHQLIGSLILPDSPKFEKDRRGHSMYPYLADPVAIAYCKTEADVADCLAWIKSLSEPLAFCFRSGGHCNAGYSMCDGLVIDVSNQDAVQVDRDFKHVWVGSGATLGQVNKELHRHGLHVPGGECASVGVAGHSMGGGYGFTSRLFGLNCDAIDALTMQLADGRWVYADQNKNPALFWAVRGATGNTLGALLKVRYRTVPLGKLWAFVIKWPIEEAPKVLNEIQKNFVRHGFTDQIGYQMALAPYEDTGEEGLFFMGLFNGPQKQGEEWIRPLMNMGSAKLVKSKSDHYINLNAYLLSWYKDPPLQSTFETKQSNFIARTLQIDEWQKVIDFYLTKPNQFNMCAFEVYGGKASNPDEPNAYIHRDVDFDFFIDSFANDSWPGSGNKEAEAWLAGFNDLMQNFSNSHKYQNYPNTHNTNYRWNYWGDAFNTLLAVKEIYDPDNFFNFQQGITPYPQGEDIKRSTAAPLFKDIVIDYPN